MLFILYGKYIEYIDIQSYVTNDMYYKRVKVFCDYVESKRLFNKNLF